MLYDYFRKTYYIPTRKSGTFPNNSVSLFKFIVWVLATCAAKTKAWNEVFQWPFYFYLLVSSLDRISVNIKLNRIRIWMETISVQIFWSLWIILMYFQLYKKSNPSNNWIVVTTCGNPDTNAAAVISWNIDKTNGRTKKCDSQVWT